MFGFFFKNEKGQGMVEFALSLPVFFLFVFGTIDMSWYGYNQIMFDYSYQLAGWNLNVGDSTLANYQITDYRAKDYIRKEIVANSVGIDASKIDVKNPKIILFTEDEYLKYPDGWGQTQYRRKMDITATITYEIKPLSFVGEIIFGRTIKFEKNMHRLRVLRATTEKS